MRTMSPDRKSFRNCLLAVLPGCGPLTLAAALACALLAAPQQAAANDCERLSPSPWTSALGGTMSPDDQKPQNVSAEFYTDYVNRIGFNVSWSIPSQFPRSVLTGHCVEVRHPGTGNREEHCSTQNPTATSVNDVSACFGSAADGRRPYCPRGSFDIRVRFQVSCTNTFVLPWSDTVSATND